MPRKKYDCLKCPGYCCSYPVIEVRDRDAVRIAKHFDMPHMAVWRAANAPLIADRKVEIITPANVEVK